MGKWIVAPDSFKGTVSAQEFCRIAEREIRACAPGSRVVSLPLADGGEGTADCFLYAVPDSQKVEVSVSGPFGELCEAYYVRMGSTAVIEMAQCAGLPQVEGREDPMRATTYGVGQMIAHAVGAGCKKIVVGLGGSCTNDGGAGMAAALGTVFTGRDGRSFVPSGGTLREVAAYDAGPARALLAGVELTAMCDIDNPLYGPSGAACVFAPQKGADAAMVQQLDHGLQVLGELMDRTEGRSVSAMPGAGAAGGLGAGIAAFLGGSLRSGIETVLDLVDFDRELEGAQLVITGEGRIDGQSLRGKTIAGVAGRARSCGVPVAVVAGSIEPGAEGAYALGVTAMFSTNPRCELFETARLSAEENLAAAVRNVARLWCAARGEAVR